MVGSPGRELRPAGAPRGRLDYRDGMGWQHPRCLVALALLAWGCAQVSPGTEPNAPLDGGAGELGTRPLDLGRRDGAPMMDSAAADLASSPGRDFAEPPDLAAASDLAAAPDFAPPSDFATPADLARPRPADLARPPADLVNPCACVVKCLGPCQFGCCFEDIALGKCTPRLQCLNLGG